MRLPRLALPAVTALVAWGCGGARPTAPAVSVPAPSPAATARYRVTFDGTWSAQTHPNEVPPVPHFSGLIGATHREPARFWTPGALASDGIKNMAELGSKSPLDQEIQAAIAAGVAQHLLSGGGISSSPGRVELEFEISRDYPLVTLVSMLAPSPDWFVGVSALSLLEADWSAERVVTLHPYDAGTDSGRTFLAPDRPTVPRDPVTRIASGPLVVDQEVPPVGTFTFRRLAP